MSSTFRKPTRNFRQKAKNSDSDTEDHSKTNIGENTKCVDTSTHISQRQKGTKTELSSKKILSFEHEEEDCEEFKVKKSSHSKRIAKQLKREKKGEDQVDSKEASLPRDQPGIVDPHGGDDVERAINLKKLRLELKTLNGDEAEALDSDDKGSEDSVLFRNRLARGEIPDAKTIHYIRKQREMARNSEDFLVLEQADEDVSASGTSRLIRDDDLDKSDEDDDDGMRVNFSINKAARERQQIRDDFMAAEHGSDEDERFLEEKNWEAQQIQKAVKQVPDTLSWQQQHVNGCNAGTGSISGPDLSIYGPNLATPVPMIPQALNNMDFSQITIDSVRRCLQERMESLGTVFRGHRVALDSTLHDFEEAQSEIGCSKESTGGLEERFRFFQEMRGYVRDLIECLNEKVPGINELEGRMHSLMRDRAVKLVQRRQQDVGDQCRDYMTNKTVTSRAVDGSKEEQAKQRRVAEREARRSRRRRSREADCISVKHHEGLSSDDEENKSELIRFTSSQQNIESSAGSLFEDALEDFSSFDVICGKLEEWKLWYGDTYREAYITLCIPKLVNPFARLQLIGWSPLKLDCENLEGMPWYRSLLMYGCRQQVVDAADIDVNLLSSVVEKVVFPKLTYLVEHVWDPVSSVQTSPLVNLTRHLVDDYMTITWKSKHVQVYLQAVANRIKRALDDDVFTPLYPMSVLDNRSSAPATFFHRQSWFCIKLLANILSWHGILGDELLRRLALDGLLNRYIVLGLANSHVDHLAMEKCRAVVSTLPKAWFTNLTDDKTIPRLENLCRYLCKAADLVHTATCRQSDLQRNEGRLLLKQISKQLVSIHAMDHALSLSNKYSFKLNAC